MVCKLVSTSIPPRDALRYRWIHMYLYRRCAVAVGVHVVVVPPLPIDARSTGGWPEID